MYAATTEVLRICRDCGLEAYLEEDLELFRKHKASRHGRQNLCGRCCSKRHNRTTEFLEVFHARADGLQCHFCGKEVTNLERRHSDSLIIHSLDGNHRNWDHANKVPAHRACHNTHHFSGEKSVKWKGDEATDAAKYRRELKRRRGR